MGKSMNLNNLTPEEAQQILKVIQKDFELRQKERDRLSKIEEVIHEEENKTEVLSKQQKFNENCCIRCCQTFGFIFNRKQICQVCKLYVCKSCTRYDDSIKGYICKACMTETEWKQKSLSWFYDNVSRKYKRFGSAKVVRTLYKHKDPARSSRFHWSDGDDAIIEEPENVTESDVQADNESDSGYDPSLYNSFGQSGSLRVKSRPSLNSIFPGIAIANKDSKEIDNGLFSPPPPLTPVSPARNNNGHVYHGNNNGSEGSPDTSMESIQTSTQTMSVGTPRMSTTPTQTNDDLDTKEFEKQDIYKEAFESTKRTEEAKFKVRFDNLLQEMQQSFENLSPRDGQVLSGYGSTSYGDLMTTYRGRVKDLLVSLSQRLELAVESFDETCAHNPSLTSQKVKLMISKLVEDRLGESLDLTSDEAVSDLSSLSDDSGEQKSLEDQIAQAVIARVLELHRTQTGVHLDLDEPTNRRNSDSSGSEVKTVVRSRGSSMTEEPNVHETGPNDIISQNSANKQESVNRNNEKGDINANIQQERAKWKKGEQPYSGDDLYHTENGDDDIDGDDKVEDVDDINFSGRLSPSVNDTVGDDDTFTDDADTRSGKKRKRQSSSNSESDVHSRPRSNSKTSEQRLHSESESVTNEGLRPRLGSSYCEEEDGEEDMKILQKEFQKLRTFAKEIVPKPLYEEANFVEEVEPEPIEESMECVTVDHEESQDEFNSRFFTYDKVHDSENRGLPDFGDLDYEYHDFGVNEVDPDLLSMNLAPILEETEEELAEEEEDNEEENDGVYEQDWRGNWLFKGALGSVDRYDNINSKSRLSAEFGDGYVMVPRPNEILAPQIGNQDVDDMSDLSENDDRDLSDEENSFYSKTSEEIARITRKTSSSTQASALMNTSIQTDGESDLESVASRPFSSSFSDSGFRGNKVDQSFDSRMSEKIKLSEELIPAEGDDPKFEIPPDSITIAEGEPAKLSCRVAGTQSLDVFWYKVGAELEELENSENFEIMRDGSRHNLNMYNMTSKDAGQYMCMAINEKGNCSQYFILKVKKNTMELKAPEFLKDLTDVEVKEGQSVKFRCKVKGIPQPRVVWYKDGQILMNQLNYKLERFGNRDYILAIDSATMDEDAEYCALAKNIAGEARSSAQLIVEPKHKPESVPATSKAPKHDKTEVKDKSDNDFPDLSYLRLGRPKSTSKTPKSTSSIYRTPDDRKESSGKMPGATTDHTDGANLNKLSEKLTKAKESVSDVAEEMLSSSKELNEIDRSIAAMDKLLEDLESDVYSVNTDDVDNAKTKVNTPLNSHQLEYSNQYFAMQDGAKNVRKMTESTLDYLNGADSVIMREKRSGAMATSTPRSSDTERVFNPDSDNSHIACDTSDVTMDTALDTSDDSHKSEIVFKLNPMTINIGSAKNTKPVVKTGRRSFSRSSSNEDEKVSKNQVESQNNETLHTDRQSSSDTSQTTYSPNVSMETSDLNTSHPSIDSNSSEPLRVNLGPKRENKEPYHRDFYITDTPKLARKTPPHSPRDEKQTSHTEEKIYLATSSVSQLENKVQSLQDKMRAVNMLQQQDKMEQIEGQVAQTVAQVASTELQVKDIEKSVSKLTAPQKGKAVSTKSRQAPSAPGSRTPTTEKHEPTFLKGDTKEHDIPESRTEFNEDYASIELPSVNRLKAMFGGIKEDKDSSIKRTSAEAQDVAIHSITARSVPKEQLEKLRQTSDDNPHARVAMTTKNPNEPVQSGRATAITTGQQIKSTPNKPKQVYQSGNVSEPSIQMVTPKQSIQVSSNTKQTSADSKTTKSQTTMKINLGSGNINKPISSDVTLQPIKQTVTSQIHNSKSNSQSRDCNVPSSQSEPCVVSGNEIDTPEERKSPKIKSGAISAMSKFWENRSQGVQDDNAPDLLEYE